MSKERAIVGCPRNLLSFLCSQTTVGVRHSVDSLQIQTVSIEVSSSVSLYQILHKLWVTKISGTCVVLVHLGYLSHLLVTQ